jgi:two-component system chemotaxis response regulator CheY
MRGKKNLTVPRDHEPVMTQDSIATSLNLPATLDADAAPALVADLKNMERVGEVRLNAAAVTSISPGYLQILVSAFRTFPQMTVSDASAGFVESFAVYGLAYPMPSNIAESAAVDTAALADASPDEVPAAPPDEPESPAIPVAATEKLPAETVAAPSSAVAPCDADAAAASDAPQTSDTAMPKTILTIDDSRTMRDMLKMALGGAGFTVVQAIDGEDGLTALAKQPVDLIITDINMPKLDGYGVIRAVRKDPAYNDTPILVLSTEGEQESKDIAKDAGATGWIVKPFDPDGLVKIVNTVCG